MKVVFVGPSLPNASEFASDDIVLRPPACQGDIMQALADGATAIGIIDGQFGMVAPVWHKEILFALTKGIPILGAASMGALRAAECEAFGMIGVGAIFEQYASGARVDDADVALIYGPSELGYPPLSIPLVSAEATIDRIAATGHLCPISCDRLREAAQTLFFKKRTWKRIAEKSGLNFETLKPVLDACWVDQKKLDAIALLQTIAKPLPVLANNWQFNATPLFRKLYL